MFGSSESLGRRFESCRAHHFLPVVPKYRFETSELRFVLGMISMGPSGVRIKYRRAKLLLHGPIDFTNSRLRQWVNFY